MALATQCPHCYTCFRVANDQLKLHAGLVRCGACQSTFNGIEHLLAPGAKPKPAPSTSLTAPVAPDTVPVASSVAAETAPAITPADTTWVAPASHTPDAPPQDIEASVETVTASHQATSTNLDFDLDFEDQFGHLPDPDSGEKQKQEPEIDSPYSIDMDIDAWATVGIKAAEATETVESSNLTNPEHEAAAEISVDVDVDAIELPAAQHEEPGEMTAALAEADSFSDADESDEGNEGNEAEQETALAIEEDTPGFIVQAEKQRKYGRLWRMLLWILTPLLVLSACAQASYLWRNELAAQLPQSKPWLTQACAMLNTITSCRISLPAEIEQILIESNELQTIAEQANKPKLFALALQLQNHSSTAQTWPTIALTLNDQKDKAVIRRIFAPNDYLPIKTDPTIISRGFAANGEQSIKLYFELEGVEAAGYHVGTYYP